MQPAQTANPRLRMDAPLASACDTPETVTRIVAGVGLTTYASTPGAETMGIEMIDSIFSTASAVARGLLNATEGVARGAAGIRAALSAQGWLQGLEAYARHFGRPL